MTPVALPARPTIQGLPIDDKRGTGGMILFIVTEAMLFVALFFAYFQLGAHQPQWPMDDPPKLLLALIMLAVLLSSSAVLLSAEYFVKHHRQHLARLAVVGTFLLGLVFLALQILEYRDHLRTLRPTTDAYGSIFYTITSIHGAHIVLGLLMLGYVACLPKYDLTEKPPHRPLRNAGLYWHFVDAAWIVIVLLLYVWPNLEA